MSDAILYVDTSDVREGALEELKPAIERLADFVEANEPRLIAYNVYFSEDGTRMTVASVHPDSASLEYHLEVAGPLFREFVELVTLSSIYIYGEPSEKVLQQSQAKARLLAAALLSCSACMQVSLVPHRPLGRTRAKPRYARPAKRATEPTISVWTSVSCDAKPCSSPR
jgi:hypothetical protein